MYYVQVWPCNNVAHSEVAQLNYRHLNSTQCVYQPQHQIM